jgi:hypothetical protein
MNNINLGVIVDLPKEHFPFWKDGFRAALDVLAYDYHWNVYIYNIQDSPKLPVNHDFYLFWGSLNAKQHQIRNFAKQGLVFGGGVTYSSNLHNFDIIFAESRVDYLDFKRYGIKTVQAFGTNTNIFKPMDKVKIFDYLYPAAFAKWKRHDKFVDFVKRQYGSKIALAIGYVQPGGWEKECHEICEQNGILTLPWVPAETLAHIYNASKNVVITADPDGGCQRTVLEAKSCGINVIIESSSLKLKELSKLKREDVVTKWSHITYAKKLADGIQSALCEK